MSAEVAELQAEVRRLTEIVRSLLKTVAELQAAKTWSMIQVAGATYVLLLVNVYNVQYNKFLYVYLFLLASEYSAVRMHRVVI